MKNTIKVDHIDKRLVMDRTFAKNAENVRSEEYTILQRVRIDYPEYTVVRREIRKNDKKERYRGLTYEYMEKYIADHDNAKENRAAYDNLQLLAKCHSVRYPHIKQWFLDTYPEVRDFGMSQQENEKSVERPEDQSVEQSVEQPVEQPATIQSLLNAG